MGKMTLSHFQIQLAVAYQVTVKKQTLHASIEAGSGNRTIRISFMLF